MHLLGGWLAEQFAAWHEYYEAEVNQVLQQYHPDSATLRRKLIGLGLLARENGFYWRVTAD